MSMSSAVTDDVSIGAPNSWASAGKDTVGQTQTHALAAFESLRQIRGGGKDESEGPRKVVFEITEGAVVDAGILGARAQRVDHHREQLFVGIYVLDAAEALYGAVV